MKRGRLVDDRNARHAKAGWHHNAEARIEAKHLYASI
jgi:hypothetical protein